MLLILTHFLFGIKDALRYSNSIPGFKKKHLSCAALSAFIWISICLFNKLAMPSLTWLKVDPRVEHWLSNAFSALWVVPLVLTSKIVTALWFMEAADSVYQATGRKKKAPGSRIAEGIADLIFSLIIYVVFMIQASLVKALPLEGVNTALYFLHLSLLHAWTAFEYKWYPMGIEIRARLATVETRWGYFLGFGFPLACTTLIDPITSGCLFAILFPMSILAAHMAASPDQPTSFRLRIFGPTMYIADSLSSVLFKWFLKKKKSENSRGPSVSYQTTPLSSFPQNHVPRSRKLY